MREEVKRIKEKRKEGNEANEKERMDRDVKRK